MEDLILTESEEKTLVGLLYNHVSLMTTQEMLGEFNGSGLKKAEAFRAILSKLLRKYDLVKTLSQENLLLLGLTDLMDEHDLAGLAAQDSNLHLKNRAKYFLNKRYEQ